MKKYEEEFGEKYLSNKAFDIFDDAYEFFSQELSKSFLDECDAVEIILEVSNAQERVYNFDNTIKFANLLRTKQPVLYEEAFVYLGDAIIDYYCFKGDIESSKPFFDDFRENSLTARGEYLLVFRKALYSGLTDIVEHFVTDNYREILDSDEEALDIAQELAAVKLRFIFEEAYNNRENGINKALVAEQMSAYNFHAVDNIIMELEKAITQPWIAPPFAPNMTRENQNLSLLNLEVYFLQWMSKKGFPFYISGAIWDNLLAYWGENNLDRTLAGFFVLNLNTFKAYIDNSLSFNLSKNTFECAATLWGSVYVYDFFLELGILTSKAHAKYCGYIEKTKAKFIGGSICEIWTANFVHDWEKPSSVSDKDFDAERKLFEKSYSVSEYKFSEVRASIADELEQLGEFGAEIIKVGEKSDKRFDEISDFSLDHLFSLENDDDLFEMPGNLSDNESFTPKLEAKVGRNEPCPCDSGKKYKKCCGKN